MEGLSHNYDANICPFIVVYFLGLSMFFFLVKPLRVTSVQAGVGRGGGGGGCTSENVLAYLQQRRFFKRTFKVPNCMFLNNIEN